MRRARFALLLLLTACDVPADTLTQSCRFDLSTTVECTVRGQALTKNQSALLDPRRKNLKVRVKGSFTLQHGKVAVVFLGCAERARVDVVPGAPVAFSCESEVNRRSYQFPIDVFVFGGAAEGLEGQLQITPL